MSEVLDDAARVGLEALGPAAAEAILREVGAKGDVVNPSAYVMRAVVNARRGHGVAAHLASAQKARPHVLDEQARRALEEIGTEVADVILQQLASKGDAVNNPSAYVLRAVGNARKGQGAGGLAVNRDSVFGEVLGTWSSVLDAEAVQALNGVSVAVASGILKELESRGTGVNNPSAYVVRSVGNAKRGGVQNSIVSPVLSHFHPTQRFVGNSLDSLDDAARQSLDELGAVASEMLLQELHDKGSNIKNPSAYIMRAVVNARHGQGAAGASDHGFFSETPSFANDCVVDHAVSLDEQARRALEEIGTEVAGVILQQLASKGDAVHNPSAYVLRAVGNARKGQGAGGLAVNRDSVFGEVLGTWSSVLDAEAVQALNGVSVAVASGILKELETRGTGVNNPSAYVVRSVGNAKRASPNAEMQDPSWQSQKANTGPQLDDKALEALQEVGMQVAAQILHKLHTNEKVANPSAYIMKAVANEKRHSDLGDEHFAKRQRF